MRASWSRLLAVVVVAPLVPANTDIQISLVDTGSQALLASVSMPSKSAGCP